MQRRIFPLILLYGFGLALALSLVFNGFLLYEQIHPKSPLPDDSGNFPLVDDSGYQRQLLDCVRSNQHKDSLIHRMELASAGSVTAHHTSKK